MAVLFCGVSLVFHSTTLQTLNVKLNYIMNPKRKTQISKYKEICILFQNIKSKAVIDAIYNFEKLEKNYQPIKHR